jgi:hypothetical protein
MTALALTLTHPLSPALTQLVLWTGFERPMSSSVINDCTG